jgi:hypothetical protein
MELTDRPRVGGTDLPCEAFFGPLYCYPAFLAYHVITPYASNSCSVHVNLDTSKTHTNAPPGIQIMIAAARDPPV